MKSLSGHIRLSATDLSSHLACRHLTTLDLGVARGKHDAPAWRSPGLKVIQELGKRHEAAYLKHLRDQGISLVDLRDGKEQRGLAETRSCMERGVEAIAQGSLAAGRWFGMPDVMRKVATPSRLGGWSYEVYDCKLTRETKATTILQLALYSALLKEIQGEEPEFMYVVPAGRNFEPEPYRVAEFAAYYRYVRARLEKVCDDGQGENTYPEPCVHCDICRWFGECDARRRGDDHLSLVAGIRRQQRDQVEEWGAGTMTQLAALPIPLKQRPTRGSREGIEHVREQARVQVAGRLENRPVREVLLPVAEGTGFCRLPEPSADDVFVDLEGDPFVGESGLQYLFGLAWQGAGGELRYEKRWALSRGEEKSGFEWLVDEIMRRRKANPRMHVYHFGAYEPSAFKRLMGMHATREDEIDRMLRAGALVDLHQAFKQSVRASVEEYSLKKIEVFYGFERQTPLDDSRAAMRYVEHRLELGWSGEGMPEPIREAMEGYNSEDCFSTAKLRDWLEEERRGEVERGTVVPRFVDRGEAASEELDERQKRVAALVEKLTAGISADLNARTNEQQARWLLAQLQDWHRREDKAAFWEGYRLADLDDEELLEERAGLAGLKFVKRLLVERRIPVDRYAFEKQETEARVGKDLFYKGEKFGSVSAIDPVRRRIDIEKTKRTAELHPTAVYIWERPFNVKDQADALFKLGEWVVANGIDAPGRYRAGRDLLLRKSPRLLHEEKLEPLASETTGETASRIVLALEDSLFAIQGPPGSGKTYTGARMVCELVRQGKKVGIAAFSHKAIHKFLRELQIEAGGFEKGIRCVRKITDEDPMDQLDGVELTKKPEIPLLRLRSGQVHVAAGTSWLWTRAEYSESVDTLFVDEAGQMSLANVVAMVQCAKNLVLLGDPQQLEQPLKGSHPEGAEKSALEHLLNGKKTIAEDMGFLLPQSWRLHPEICKFTSEVFYEGKLSSNETTRSRVLEGHAWLNAPGLWFVPVEHDGNRNSCPEEVEVVARIVQGLLRPGVRWFRSAGNIRRLTKDDILIVAPYNAQVADLSARLPEMRIGTVDKFQGQEAPVVIYSLTTSSPEEAPRGMEFLYSLNRLNVATSRAMSNAIVVANPRLFEPECGNPRQMQLASALCRYRELATVHMESA